MKYNIEGFNQEEALQFRDKDKRLDIIDLSILRWIVDFNPSMVTKDIDGEKYFWINYQYVLEQMPILGVEKRSLYRKLQKMCDFGILKHKNVKEKGNYSFYTFGPNYNKLIMSKTTDSCVADDNALASEKTEQRFIYQKDSYIPPTSPPQEKIRCLKEVYEDIIGYMNERVCNDETFTNKVEFHYKTTNKNTQKLINARLDEGYTADDFKDVIFYCYREWVNEPKKFKNGQTSVFYYRPATMFNATNFESYLNNYKATL